MARRRKFWANPRPSDIKLRDFAGELSPRFVGVLKRHGMTNLDKLLACGRDGRRSMRGWGAVAEIEFQQFCRMCMGTDDVEEARRMFGPPIKQEVRTAPNWRVLAAVLGV